MDDAFCGSKYPTRALRQFLDPVWQIMSTSLAPRSKKLLAGFFVLQIA